MPAFVTLGRILFSVLFVLSGVLKLMNVSATAQMTEKVVFPAIVAPYTEQLVTMTGMPICLRCNSFCSASPSISGMRMSVIMQLDAEVSSARNAFADA